MRFHKDGTLPNDGEIFVFGSNLRGLHGAGAAKVAVTRYGAKLGNPIGFQGRSYAIPTKDTLLQPLPLDAVKEHVKAFVDFTNLRPELSFFITRVGCGLAGYQNYELAPMFIGCNDNCSFPDVWIQYLSKPCVSYYMSETEYLTHVLNKSL